MSKYNKYAKSLDGAFRIARSAYSEALEELEKARTAESIAQRRGNAEELAHARARYLTAENNFNKIKAECWQNFSEEVQQLTNELKAEIKNDNKLNPDAIDSNALELLKSGVLTADDMAELATKYDSNPTMLKLISKYSGETAKDTSLDNATRIRFLSISTATKDGMSSIMKTWETLCTAASIYSGQNRGNLGSSYGIEISKHWDDESITQSIANF